MESETKCSSHSSLTVGVGLSGGTDSAAAALRLLEDGYTVIGFTLILSPDSPVADKAAAVAGRLGIPFHAIDLREAFDRLVLQPCADAYAQGLTPSPCVVCNRHFKFGALWDAVSAHGCDRLATGHYARILRDGARCRLLRGLDTAKDQSYFLAQLTQTQLSHAILPLGDCRKQDLRPRIAELGLVPPAETESQDLCFLPDGDLTGFILARHPELNREGPIRDTHGKTLGRHHGAFRYTPGQRRGLGLGGGPWFVLRTDLARNTVTVAHQEDMLCRECTLDQLNWLLPKPPPVDAPLKANVQIRYQMKPRPASLIPHPDGTATLTFDEPIMAAPPGQLAVAYHDDEVIASGWLTR